MSGWQIGVTRDERWVTRVTPEGRGEAVRLAGCWECGHVSEAEREAKMARIIKTENGAYLVEPYEGGWVYQPDEPLQIHPWSEVYETAEAATEAARAEAANRATDALDAFEGDEAEAERVGLERVIRRKESEAPS